MATPDQNQAVGTFALQQLDRRMKLLKTARGSSRWGWIGSWIAILSVPVIHYLVDTFFPNGSYSMIIVLCLLPAIFAIRWDVNRAHSRLDALLQLIGEDKLAE